MQRTAKPFRNGRSQAVRLPSEVGSEGEDVILSRRPESWESFFQLAQEANVPEDFMTDRADTIAQKLDLF